MTDELKVANSAVPEQVISTGRALCLWAAGYLAGRGWIDHGLGDALVAFGFALAPWLYNQWRIRNQHKKLKAAATGSAVVVMK
ncbi:hypothetical protein GG804_29110 [Sphingomonas histidinilytica]|jgi:hypothetical protein|uniref:Pam3-gp28 family putative phage holin n=1 Tax=Rhizorhabdus histidinilytica TaxID=439228 RepID=UPI001ADD55E2|nr:hypothetical protein [Rhizorhabdus histidinilytica]MBO9380821.1 hypothetical protein [Rhizorhabdus histidinilytica]